MEGSGSQPFDFTWMSATKLWAEDSSENLSWNLLYCWSMRKREQKWSDKMISLGKWRREWLSWSHSHQAQFFAFTHPLGRIWLWQMSILESHYLPTKNWFYQVGIRNFVLGIGGKVRGSESQQIDILLESEVQIQNRSALTQSWSDDCHQTDHNWSLPKSCDRCLKSSTECWWREIQQLFEQWE